VQIWANINLWLLRGVPPKVAGIAMAAAHYFIRAVNSSFGRYNMDAE